MNSSQLHLYSLVIYSVISKVNEIMFDLMDLFWTCVIAGSIITIAIRLRAEMKNAA